MDPATDNGNGSRVVRALDRKQARRLEDYIKANWDRIERERPSYPAVAKEASSALGFEISPSSVRLAVDVLELDWPRRPAAPDMAAITHNQRLLAAAMLRLEQFMFHGHDITPFSDDERRELSAIVGDVPELNGLFTLPPATPQGD
jgi:hypothetical protein